MLGNSFGSSFDSRHDGDYANHCHYQQYENV